MQIPTWSIIPALAFASSLFSGAHAAEKAPEPSKILALADRARGGLSSGVSWTVKVDSKEEGQATAFEYEVKVKGLNVLATCTNPPRQKGETFLFNDRNLWVHRPNLRKPISVSTRQRLSGSASNGDIATTNYASDYEATIVGEETIDGAKTWKLFLKGKDKDVTYDAINYWVDQKKFLGVRAEFLTLDKKVLKRADFTYANKIPLNGKATPFVSQMKVVDPNMPDSQTTLTYSGIKTTKLNDEIFNVNNLAR